VGFQPVGAPYMGSEVADSGLAGRSAAVGAQIGGGVIEVDAAADGGGLGNTSAGVRSSTCSRRRAGIS